MSDVKHHFFHGPAERRKNNVQVVDDDRYAGSVDREEIVEVSKQPARGLNLFEHRRDLIMEFEVQRGPNFQESIGDLVSPLSLPPATQQLLHAYCARDINSTFLW